jgi:hypothetical protein
MDRPTSRRAAIGRALNAREPLSTDAFLSLTEEERLRGITLFSDEPARAEQHDTFEQGPAPVAPMVARARMFRHLRAAGPPDSPIMEAWQRRVLAAMLAAAVAGFAVASVRMMQTPSQRQGTVPVAAAPKPVGAAVSPSVVAANELTPAVVPDATPALAPDTTPAVAPDATPVPPAPPRPALLTAPEREAQPVRAEPPIRTAVVSRAIVAEPPPAVDEPIAPSPAPTLPAPPLRVDANAAPVRVPAPEAAIETVLSRYRAAYQDLDAAAARAVWPSADTKALRRAFDRLEAQELVFDSCAVSVSDARAVAVCSGTASYVPRVGKKARRGDQRQWEFELSKADDGWLIDTVSAR